MPIVTEGREGSALPTMVKRDLYQVEVLVSVCFGGGLFWGGCWYGIGGVG